MRNVICLCGSNDLRETGGSFSPVLVYQHVACQSCGRWYRRLSSEGGGAILLGLDPSLDSRVSENWEHIVDWVINVLLQTWRARSVALRDHEAAEWKAWRRDVLLQHDTSCPLTDEERDLARMVFGPHLNRIGMYIPLPADLLCPVYPPQLPEGVLAWYAPSREGDAPWVQVDHAISRGLPVPPDLIVVEHEAMLVGARKEVEAVLGYALPDPKKVPNEYGGKAPWHQFDFPLGSIVVGCRTRVVSLTLESSVPVATAPFRRLAKRDQVTYCASGGSRHITLHASTQATLVEYLVAFVRAVKKARPKKVEVAHERVG